LLPLPVVLLAVNQMASIIEKIVGVKVKRNYNLDAPKGVRERNSDNTLIQKEFGWESNIPPGRWLGENLCLHLRSDGIARQGSLGAG